MSSLVDLMEEYIKKTKGKIDFNSIPGEVITFTKKLTAIDLEIAYRQMTRKKQSDKTQGEKVTEMIFMLLTYKREMF